MADPTAQRTREQRKRYSRDAQARPACGRACSPDTSDVTARLRRDALSAVTGKPALRTKLRAARDAASGPPLPAWPAFTARLTPGLTVASYMPTGGEADPATLAEAATAAGCRLALPHVVDRATPLRFLAWPGDAALVPGPFGLCQPPADLPPLAPDIILTPLVGFDRRGNRLGQGAGHYDRAFAEHPGAWRVGVAWSVQEVDALTPDPWDVPLHAIATDKEWITP